MEEESVVGKTFRLLESKSARNTRKLISLSSPFEGLTTVLLQASRKTNEVIKITETETILREVIKEIKSDWGPVRSLSTFDRDQSGPISCRLIALLSNQRNPEFTPAQSSHCAEGFRTNLGGIGLAVDIPITPEELQCATLTN